MNLTPVTEGNQVRDTNRRGIYDYGKCNGVLIAGNNVRGAHASAAGYYSIQASGMDASNIATRAVIQGNYPDTVQVDWMKTPWSPATTSPAHCRPAPSWPT